MPDYSHSAMLAFYPQEPPERWFFGTDGDLPGARFTPHAELHLTLVYLGDTQEMRTGMGMAVRALHAFAAHHGPVAGRVNGAGRFADDEEGAQPFVALYDASALPTFRQDLIGALGCVGMTSASEHGFIPHLTLAYLPVGVPTPNFTPDFKLDFDTLWLVWNGERIPFKLGAAPLEIALRALVPGLSERQVLQVKTVLEMRKGSGHAH